MIIIVGGTGFLGRHFRDLLSAKGEKSVTVTRNLAEAQQYAAPGEQFVAAEEFRGKLAENMISTTSAVVYLAASSTPSAFAETPWLEISQTVAPISEFMLRFAAINPNAKLIYISSGGAIYGNSEAGAAREDQQLVPISAYGLGKQMVEQALQFGGRAYGLKYNILRVSNPIGRHHRNGRQGVVPAAIRSLLAGTEFTMFGDGSVVRDYIDADDVAEAMWEAYRDTQFDCRIWNVGSGVGYSLLQILELVQTISDRKLRIQRLPVRKVDVKRIVLNCERISADLGWFPKRDIAQTIADMWTYQSQKPAGRKISEVDVV